MKKKVIRSDYSYERCYLDDGFYVEIVSDLLTGYVELTLCHRDYSAKEFIIGLPAQFNEDACEYFGLAENQDMALNLIDYGYFDPYVEMYKECYIEEV